MHPLRPSHAPMHHLGKSITQLPAKDRLRGVSASLIDGLAWAFYTFGYMEKESSLPHRSFSHSFIHSFSYWSRK